MHAFAAARAALLIGAAAGWASAGSVSLNCGATSATAPFSCTSGLFSVTIDTSALNLTAGSVDFQFNPGGGTNLDDGSVAISDFSGPSLGSPIFTSGIFSGTLGPTSTLTLGNSGALNEVTQSIVTYGNTLSFGVEFATTVVGSADTATALYMTLYDASGHPTQASDPSGAVLVGAITPIPTSDPNFSDEALSATWDDTTAPASSGTPEPASGWLLLGGGLAGFAGLRRLGCRA